MHEAICGDTTVVNGKEMINFSSYNYVGNSGDPVVSKAAHGRHREVRHLGVGQPRGVG